MINFFVRRGRVFLTLTALGIFFFQSNLVAQGAILKHSGTIRVTSPDGVVLAIEPGQALPDILSGSKVEVLNGSIEIEPAKGFIQLVLGGAVATVKAGDSVTASIDEKTGTADFKVKTGQVNVITGNTTITLGAGQEAQVGLDKVTGITTIKSIAGEIGTVTVGVKAVIPEGAMIKIKADAKTRNVHIECVKGDMKDKSCIDCMCCKVIAIDGKAIELKESRPIDTPGSAEGEIQAFAEEEPRFEPVEEPPEPEQPEASRYMP